MRFSSVSKFINEHNLNSNIINNSATQTAETNIEALRLPW